MLAEDIKRFEFFSHGYISLFPGDKPLLGDTRYSMLPTSAQPIWGIELDLADQQSHTPFNQFHDSSDLTRQTFIRSEEHRLNSSHITISYAVFCLKKKKKT